MAYRKRKKKTREAGLSAADKMRLLVAEMVLEQLTGEKVHLKISMLRMDQKAVDTLKQNTPDPIVQREGWGVEYDLHESYSESEKDDVCAAWKRLSCRGQKR